MSGPGHNSNGVAAAQLKSIFSRWQKIEEEKAALSDDSKELFAEAKGNGYDTKALRAAFRHVAKLADNRAGIEEHQALFDLYVGALEGGEARPTPSRTRVAREAPAPEATSPTAIPEGVAVASSSARVDPSVPFTNTATVTPIGAKKTPARAYDEGPLLDACRDTPEGVDLEAFNIAYGRDFSKEAARLVSAKYIRFEDGRYLYDLKRSTA